MVCSKYQKIKKKKFGNIVFLTFGYPLNIFFIPFGQHDFPIAVQGACYLQKKQINYIKPKIYFLFKNSKFIVFSKFFKMFRFVVASRGACLRLRHQYNLQNSQCERNYSEPGRRPGFLSKFLENIKSEMNKSNEMKENIKKFREEAQKLEQSEALQSARQKFNIVEAEAHKSSSILKEQLGTIKEKVTDVIDEASKTDIAKKASKITEEISKTAKGVTDTISEKGEKLGQMPAFQAISDTTKLIKNEIDSQSMNSRVYRPPIKLRKRVEIELNADDRIVEPNADATGVELHKDSKFYQSWENFKNNNTYVNKVLDWKLKYDESENPVIRASRLLTDKVSDVMGGLFSKTELSETLTELCKIDPGFDQKQFLRDCETDIIPNILEAMTRGDLEILKDWCFESTYNILSTPISQALKTGLVLDSKTLDIENVDLALGKVMEQGPVLIITFQAQQILCVRDKLRKVIEGDPEKVMRVNYVWVLCRDRNELNPKAAWRLMELSANSQEQFV